MNCRNSCQVEILAYLSRQFTLSAGAQMQLTDVGVCSMFFCVWTDRCIRMGVLVFLWGGLVLCNFVWRRCGVSETEET